MRAVSLHPLRSHRRTEAHANMMPGHCLGAAAVSLVSMTVGCSGSSSSAPVTVPPNGVLVKHFAFTPSTLTVKAAR